jgi:hypothetical protein
VSILFLLHSNDELTACKLYYNTENPIDKVRNTGKDEEREV